MHECSKLPLSLRFTVGRGFDSSTENRTWLLEAFVDKVSEEWCAWLRRSSTSGLLSQGTRDVCFNDGELYGLGQLIKKIGDDLEVLEDILRSSQDSTASERNNLD
jgi:hypothetical protein